MTNITKPQIIAMLTATAFAIGVGSYANGKIHKHNDSVKTQIAQQKIINMCQALSDHGVLKSYYDSTEKTKNITLEVPSACVNILTKNITHTISRGDGYIQASELLRKTGLQDVMRPIFFDNYDSEIDKWAQSGRKANDLQFALHNMSRDLDRYATYHALQKEEAGMPTNVHLDPEMDIYATQIHEKHSTDEIRSIAQIEAALTKLQALNTVNMLPVTLLNENDTIPAIRFLQKDPTNSSDHQEFMSQLNPKVTDILAVLEKQLQQVKRMNAQLQKDGLANSGPLI